MSKVAPLSLWNTFLLSSLQLLPPPNADKHAVMSWGANRLQPAPGELVRSDKTWLHQSLTRLALSFRSHGSLCYCLIQTDSRTLGYFPLCIFWISQHDTKGSHSVWCKSRVYTCPWTWMACVGDYEYKHESIQRIKMIKAIKNRWLGIAKCSYDALCCLISLHCSYRNNIL